MAADGRVTAATDESTALTEPDAGPAERSSSTTT
jgi:hypothetical protein